MVFLVRQQDNMGCTGYTMNGFLAVGMVCCRRNLFKHGVVGLRFRCTAYCVLSIGPCILIDDDEFYHERLPSTLCIIVFMQYSISQFKLGHTNEKTHK